MTAELIRVTIQAAPTIVTVDAGTPQLIITEQSSDTVTVIAASTTLVSVDEGSPTVILDGYGIDAITDISLLEGKLSESQLDAGLLVHLDHLETLWDDFGEKTLLTYSEGEAIRILANGYTDARITSTETALNATIDSEIETLETTITLVTDALDLRITSNKTELDTDIDLINERFDTNELTAANLNITVNSNKDEIDGRLDNLDLFVISTGSSFHSLGLRLDNIDGEDGLISLLRDELTTITDAIDIRTDDLEKDLGDLNITITESNLSAVARLDAIDGATGSLINLEASINFNAEAIALRVSATERDIAGNYTELNTSIGINAGSISSLVSRVGLIDGEEGTLSVLQSSIIQTAGSIDNRITSLEGDLDDRFDLAESRIYQTEESIISTVSRITDIDGPGGNLSILASSINQQAGRIDLEVTKREETDGRLVTTNTNLSLLTTAVELAARSYNEITDWQSTAELYLGVDGINISLINSSISNHAYSIGTLQSILANQWTVTIAEDNEGNYYSAGFGLIVNPAWLSDEDYIVGSTVTVSDDVYECKLAHTATTNNSPTGINGGTYWDELPNGTKSEFTVKADSFKILTDDGPTAVFEVNGNTITMLADVNVSGTLTIGYADVTDTPTSLNDINPDEYATLTGLIDGKIYTWFQPTDPEGTTAWTEGGDDDSHTGDLWWNSITNELMRYDGADWEEITDAGSVAAFEKAEDAYDLADGKRRVFIATPYPPYDTGDMWSEGSDGDLKICVTAKETGSYDEDDWELATKYTDNTILNNFIEVTYADDQAYLEGLIDGKIDSWFQSGDPVTTWGGTAASHTGDMWWNSTTSVLKRYNGSAWVTVTDPTTTAAYQLAAAAQDTADGKRRVFVATPTDSQAYDVGDLWDRGSTLGIWRCITAKAIGTAYSAAHWQVVADTTSSNTAADTAKVAGEFADIVKTNAAAGATFTEDDAGALAYEDLIELAKLGTTIIQGGYLKNDLIQTNTLIVGYSNITGAPTSLEDINVTQYNKLTGIATGATANDVFFQSSQPTGTSGDIWVDTDDNQIYTHNGSSWVAGKSGKDGDSIVWKGSLSSAPSSPQNLWAYYNTTDKKSYLYNGAWYQMSTDGSPGTDGISISWKGSSASPPSSPQLNWAYRDTDNGISYIYNGTGWEILTEKGLNGLDGAAGGNTATVSIYYKNTSSTVAPTDDISGTFTYNFSTKSLSGGTFNGWSTTLPTATAGQYIWVKQATAYSIEATDSITYSEFSAAVCLTGVGSNGAAGLNSAPIFLYRKSTSTLAPSAFSGTFTYTFSTKALSGGTLNSWTTAAPTLTNGEYLWMRQATASSITDIDTIVSTEFSAAAIISIGGVAGTNGSSTFTYYQTTTPTGATVNELWFSSSTNQLRRCAVAGSTSLTDWPIVSTNGADWTTNVTNKPTLGTLAGLNTITTTNVTEISGGKITTGIIKNGTGTTQWNLDTGAMSFSGTSAMSFAANAYLNFGSMARLDGSGTELIGFHVNQLYLTSGNAGGSNVATLKLYSSLLELETEGTTNIVLDSSNNIEIDTTNLTYFKFAGVAKAQMNPYGLRPSANNGMLFGDASYRWNQIYGSAFYDEVGLFQDLQDDLVVMSEIKPRKKTTICIDTGAKKVDTNTELDDETGLEYIDNLSLPRWMTNYDYVVKKLKEENGDLLSEEEIHDLIQDQDEAGWMLCRNVGRFNDLTSGAVRQLDIESKEIYELIFTRLTVLENENKELKDRIAVLEATQNNLKNK